MATQLKKTVKPSGGDYTTLNACMVANEQDLIAADKWFDVEIDGTWSSADTTAVTITGYTTDATRYINIYTTAAARHTGKVTSGCYKLQASYHWDFLLKCSVGNVTIDGIVIDVLDYACYGIGYVQTIKNCIAYTTSSPHVQSYLSYYGGVYYYNNIAYGIGTCIRLEGWGTNYVYNNTAYGCNYGFSRSGGTDDHVWKNNIAYNNTTADYGGLGTCVSSNNLDKDGTSPDSAYRSKTLTFVNAAGGDFHLASTDTDAIDHGVDLHTIFTTDIDGQTRTGTWDIGADEYVSAAPPVVTTGLHFMTCSKYW